MNGLQALGNAVVKQAVDDWRFACKQIRKYENALTEGGKLKLNLARATKEECERFFKSQRFSTFTNLDGKALLNKLEREVSENVL